FFDIASPSRPFINILRNAAVSVTSGTPSWESDGYFDATNATVRLLHNDREMKIKTGVYVLKWQGTANVVIHPIKAYDYVENNPAGKIIRLNVTGRDSLGAYIAVSGGTLTDIYMCPEEWETGLLAGTQLSPDYIADMSGFSTIRFMDWMDTNASPVMEYSDYKVNSFMTVGGHPNSTTRGVPLEIIAECCNTTQSNCWITIPHKLVDTGIISLVTKLKQLLDSNLLIYVELTNEAWNFGAGFSDQTNWLRFGGVAANLVSMDPTTNVVTHASHGMTTGDDIVVFNTPTHRNTGLSAGRECNSIVIDVDTFTVASNYDDAIAEIQLPIVSKDILLYKKTTGAEDNLHKFYAERAVEVWDLCEAVLGNQLVKVGASHSNNPSTTAGRCAVIRYKRDAHFHAIAPYYNFFLDENWLESSYESLLETIKTDWYQQYFLDNIDVHLAATGRHNLICYEGGNHNSIPPNQVTTAKTEKLVGFFRSDYERQARNWYVKMLANHGIVEYANYSSHAAPTATGQYGAMEHIRHTNSPAYMGFSEFLDEGVPKSG
ncbi:hypothetical protein LCGC14_2046840, partial [marine sediment metagenome]